MHIRLRTPDLTEELVRFLRRMGLHAREIDYGVVAVESDGERTAKEVREYLRVWQQVHVRADFDLEPLAA